MRNLVLLIFVSFSIACQSQKMEEFLIIKGEKNVVDVDFGNENELFILYQNKQVEKLNIDSDTQSYSFDITANSMGISNFTKDVVFGKTDGTLLFFDNEKPTKNYKAHNKPITAITYSPSDKFLATSSLDSTIKIWSAKTYGLLQEINVKSDLVTDIKFSLDEAFLVYSTNKGAVIVWNLIDERIHTIHKISNNWIRNIAISPDSVKYAVCGDDKKITILSFKDNDYYQLKKSHGNMITNIQFINRNYLLSIGHDHYVVMNSIDIPVENAELKHFQGYPRYKKNIHNLQGDKYFSNLSISDEKNLVAISSHGKGIALTGYFHDLIRNPHKIVIEMIDDKIVDSVNDKPEFKVKNNPCIIKGKVTRPEDIKNAWLYYIKDDRKIKITINKQGEFEHQVALLDETYDYSIVVEDWDKNLPIVQYDFRLMEN